MVQRGVGQPGNDATSVMLHVTQFPTTLPWVLWDGRLLSHAVLVLQLGALDLVTNHHGITAMGVCLLRGTGVGPCPGGNEPGKKAEAGELLQALSLLQKIMTPEDFVKYQVLVAPKPKPGTTREQELADRVKSLQKGVLSRIRVESEECEELRAQVAKEQAPSDTSETVPPTQSDSQQGDDMVSQNATEEMYLSTVEEESGDEYFYWC